MSSSTASGPVRGRLFTIPLVGVLALQIIVVFAAFIAVIAVLSLQQESEFKDALYTQLSLQQGSAATDLMAPLIEREKQFDLVVQMYTEHSIKGGEAGTGYPYVSPSERARFSTHYAAFHKHFASVLELDSMVTNVLITNQSAHYDPTTHTSKWNIFVFDKSALTIVYNEQGHPCPVAFIPGYASMPLKTPDALYATCDTLAAMIPPVAVDTVALIGIDSGHENLWTRPMTIYDPVVGVNYQSIVYAKNINHDGPRFPFGNGTTAAVAMLKQHAMITVQTKHFKPVIVDASPSHGSVSALFVVDMRLYASQAEMHLVTGKISFNDTIRPPTASNDEMTTNTWVGGQTPDAILNDLYDNARVRCYSGAAASNLYSAPMNPCEVPQIFELKSNGGKYTASAVRIVDNRTKVDWMLVQYTPREEFFGASERSRTVGIVIGVVGAMVVLATCILIWAAIFMPLRQLREMMGLAAEMRNDEVELLDPILMEMSDLVGAFSQMNTKLLKARPFLPQSLLCGEDIDEDDDEFIETDDEGDNHTYASKSDIDGVMPDGSTVCATVDGSSHVTRKTTVLKALRNADSASVSSRLTSSTIASRSPTVNGKKASPVSNSLLKHKAMDMRRVGVLSVNVNGFQSATATLGHAMTAKTHAALTKLVEQCVGEERGIVDYFHGDRFVCGFNTARMCGNVGASAGQASVKLWERFRSDAALSATFPAGLSMGLSTGRAAVGNHGSDSMQRLGTLGYVFTEAMRLQEAMSRRVLSSTTSSASSSSLMRDCLGGRCLMMGRTLQDVDTALSFQVLGAVPAAELMPSGDGSDAFKCAAFARAKNNQMYRVCVPHLAADTSVMAAGASVINAASVLLASSHLMGASKSANPPSAAIVDAHQQKRSSRGSAVALPPAGSISTILVAVLCSLKKSGKADEWLYQLDDAGSANAFRDTNAFVCKLFIAAACDADSTNTTTARMPPIISDDCVKRSLFDSQVGTDGVVLSPSSVFKPSAPLAAHHADSVLPFITTTNYASSSDCSSPNHAAMMHQRLNGGNNTSANIVVVVPPSSSSAFAPSSSDDDIRLSGATPQAAHALFNHHTAATKSTEAIHVTNTIATTAPLSFGDAAVNERWQCYLQLCVLSSINDNNSNSAFLRKSLTLNDATAPTATVVVSNPSTTRRDSAGNGSTTNPNNIAFQLKPFVECVLALTYLFAAS